jgi:hypothetical protein
MDSSFTIRPRVGVQQFTSRDPRQAPETELSVDKIVAATSGEHSETDQREQRHDHAPQDVIVDPETREVIIRENDIRNQAGEHPDQALLRLRAYRPVQTEAPSATTNEPHANIKA